MDLSTFIVAVFCLIDDRIARLGRLGRLGRLRARGPAPTLFDSEVLTIEVVGEFLGLDEDTELFAYFRRHYAHFFFPNLGRVHRTTFARQAANLWKVKEYLWQELLAETPHDPGFALADSFPLPVCLFARAYRCRRFKGEVAFGKDMLLKQTFYGFRMDAREGLLAGRHYPFFGGPGQRSRALRPPRTHPAHLQSARRGPQLPLAQDKRTVG